MSEEDENEQEGEQQEDRYPKREAGARLTSATADIRDSRAKKDSKKQGQSESGDNAS